MLNKDVLAAESQAEQPCDKMRHKIVIMTLHSAANTTVAAECVSQLALHFLQQPLLHK